MKRISPIQFISLSFLSRFFLFIQRKKKERTTCKCINVAVKNVSAWRRWRLVAAAGGLRGSFYSFFRFHIMINRSYLMSIFDLTAFQTAFASSTVNKNYFVVFSSINTLPTSRAKRATLLYMNSCRQPVSWNFVYVLIAEKIRVPIFPHHILVLAFAKFTQLLLYTRQKVERNKVSGRLCFYWVENKIFDNLLPFITFFTFYLQLGTILTPCLLKFRLLLFWPNFSGKFSEFHFLWVW